jgi:hypothetical protein
MHLHGTDFRIVAKDGHPVREPLAADVVVGVLVGTLAAKSGSSDEPVHTLPGGEVHTGELPTGETTTDDDKMTMTEHTDTTP